MKGSIVGAGHWLERVAGSLSAVLIVSLLVAAVSILVGTCVLDEWHGESGPSTYGQVLLGVPFAQLLYFGTPARIGAFVPMLLLLVPLYNAALRLQTRGCLALRAFRECLVIAVYFYMMFESMACFLVPMVGGDGLGVMEFFLGFLVSAFGIVGMGVFPALALRRISRSTDGEGSLIRLCLLRLAVVLLAASALILGAYFFLIVMVALVSGQMYECPGYDNNLICYAVAPWLILLVLAGCSIHWWVYTQWLKPNGVERSLP